MYERILPFKSQTYYGLDGSRGEERLGPRSGDEVETAALHHGALWCSGGESFSGKITSLEAAAVFEPIEGCWVGREEGPSRIYAWSQGGQI